MKLNEIAKSHEEDNIHRWVEVLNNTSAARGDVVWSVNNEGKIDVKGVLRLDSQSTQKNLYSIPAIRNYVHQHGKLPFAFGTVDGNVEIDRVALRTLEGFPTRVTGSLFLYHLSFLTSLEGCTEIVEGTFDISDAPMLTSLKGCPKQVLQTCTLTEMNLSHVDCLPNVIGEGLRIANDDPSKVVSFQGCHRHVKKIGGGKFSPIVILPSNSVSILWLFAVEGIERVVVPDNPTLEKTISNLLKERADVLTAQERLLDAGFVKEARL